MKVTPNGGINFSVLDGWWWEAFDGTNGWVIGDDRMYDNADYQDFVESESIYDMLETEIVPEFYERGSDGVPRKWIARMKASMRTCTSRFSSARMVREYADRLYMPAMAHGLHLREQKFSAAKSLAEWRSRISKQWGAVEVQSFAPEQVDTCTVGATLKVNATVKLGEIDPKEVSVQLYHGPSPTNGTIEAGRVVQMDVARRTKDGIYEFSGAIPCTTSGQHGFAVRVLPKHPDISGELDMHLLKWG
jgi:starch phosphorylase